MIAVDDPLIRRERARNACDDVVEWPRFPFEFERESNARRAGTYVICDRQRAAPRFGRHRTIEGAKERKRVLIAYRQYRNALDRLCFADRQPARAGLRPPARRERIARMDRHVHDAAALHAVPRTHRSVRIYISHPVAVIARIGVENGADRAMLGGQLGLDAAPRTSVLGDHDLAFDADTEAVEHPVVVRDAVVDEDQLTGDVTVR